MSTQVWRRIMYGDNPPSAVARDRAARLEYKALALQEVERTTRLVLEAAEQQDRAMAEAHSVRCSLRQIGEAAGMSFSGVRTRLERTAGKLP
jgi:hypothetical protein